MSFFDIVLDFILMDAFEDLENPPSSVLAVLRNRWLSDSFKETVGARPFLCVHVLGPRALLILCLEFICQSLPTVPVPSLGHHTGALPRLSGTPCCPSFSSVHISLCVVLTWAEPPLWAGTKYFHLMRPIKLK